MCKDLKLELLLDILFLVSVSLLALVTQASLEFGSAKVIDATPDQNHNVTNSNRLSASDNATIKTFVNGSKMNSKNSSLCSELMGSNISRMLPCQEETPKVAPLDISPKAAPGQLSNGSNSESNFNPSAALIARDLSTIPPVDIKEYGVTDISTEDLLMVLSLLDPGNLTKVLLNIPSEDLDTVREKISPKAFDNILDKLPESEKTDINNRLSSVH